MHKLPLAVKRSIGTAASRMRFIPMRYRDAALYFYRNMSTGTRQVRTIVVVVLPRMRARIGEWP